MSKKIERRNMTQTDGKGKVLREPVNHAETNVNYRWWTLDEKDMAAAINATLLFIKQHQGSRIEQLTSATRLYGNTNAYNMIGTAFTRASSVQSSPTTQRMSYNVIESIIDTLQSKMAKNKVVPTYITNGAAWEVQMKADQITKFTQGLFYQEKVHHKSVISWTDASIWGDGFLHVYDREGKVCIERTLPHELFVDTIETLSGPAHQLHRVKIMDRDIAFELFPDLEENIALVSPATYDDVGGQGTVCDLITVIESWHLKSGADANDGVRVITIGDGSLVEERRKDYFPFAHMRYAKRPLGFYGQGVPERCQNLQGEINRNMILKQRSMWMQGSFKILLENGSKVVAQHMNNEIGTLIYYTGTPPQYVTPPATNPEVQQYIDALIAYAYAQEGVSRMSTTGEVPMGVDSGKAMRTLMQNSDDRFLFMQQELEDFTLEVARQSIEVVKDIYKEKKSYEVIFPDTNFLETVDWKDINLDESEYVLKAFPTSSLSDDLTGRLSEIQELAQAGMISPRSARKLLDAPDLEMNEALANAPENRLHQIYDKMLRKGEFTRFEPGFHDAQLGQQLALEYINYAEYFGCPDDRIQLVRDFLEQIQTEVLNPPQPMVQPGAPQAVPMAPPVSNLIPNVQGAAT